MQRTFSLIFVLAMVLASAPAAHADVISPVGLIVANIDLKTVLLAVCGIAVLSGLFLILTRKKK